MYKYFSTVLITLLFVFAFSTEASAAIGDMCFFGGISEGRKLPRTTEQLLSQTSNTRNQRITQRYSELVFLDGRPLQFDGLMDITVNGGVNENASVGSFTVTYRIYPGITVNNDVIINRTVTFRVNYRLEGTQCIYDYDAQTTNWRDVITINGTAYTIDTQQSDYGISIIEDRTPGVKYYRGDLSGRLVYTTGTGNNAVLAATQDVYGSFYGYDSPWSATETFRIDAAVSQSDWAMTYQIRPSITVNKILQYTSNDPTAISFAGNYREVTQNISGLRYDIFTTPRFMWDEPRSGTASISTVNTFEQLPAFDLTFLRGNAAEDDITQLFSMQILDGNPELYQPGEVITRGQFVTAVVKAIKLPIEQLPAPRGNRPASIITLFTDVDSTRPEFPYIQAAYKYQLAVGRANGMFYFDYPIEREEAFVILIQALGLTQMGLNPTPVTLFADDDQIADWAKRHLSVANMIGLAMPDEYGNIYPKQQISKGEAAGLINDLIRYLRSGLISDYADQIVNIPR